MWLNIEEHYHSPLVVPKENESLMFSLSRITTYPDIGGKLVAECRSAKAESFLLEVSPELFTKLEKCPEGAWIQLALSSGSYQVLYWNESDSDLTPLDLKNESMVSVTSNAISASTKSVIDLRV